jgi:hypothetical protein
MRHKIYSGDTGNSPDDTEDTPRACRFHRGAQRSIIQARAEQLAGLEVNSPNDWERFVDQATGELNWQRYEKEKLTDKGYEFVTKYDYTNSTGRTVLFEKLQGG